MLRNETDCYYLVDESQEQDCPGGVCSISSTDLAYQQGVDHFYGSDRVDYPAGSAEQVAFNQGFKDELEANVGPLDEEVVAAV